MSRAIICVAEADASLFRELLDSTDLVETHGENAYNTSTGPIIHFRLKVGMGNGINYFYLGTAWQQLLTEKRKAEEASS